MATLVADPNGGAQLLALFAANGFVHVVSCDFTQNLSETSTKTKQAPTQIGWCVALNVVSCGAPPKITVVS